MKIPNFSMLARWLRSFASDRSSRVAKLREELETSAISRNQFYDSLTEMVIGTVCRSGDCCVDVGCHRGEILDVMIAAADGGTFHAFEPLPSFYADLQCKYQDDPRVRLSDIALAEQTGTTTFQHVQSNPAYSGFRQRRYDRPDETIETIQVSTDRLDNLIDEQTTVRLIKIDVEGAELMVMRGAERILRTSQPFVIFEHARGGVKFYDYGPEDLFAFLTDHCGLQVSTLDGWLLSESSMDHDAFLETFNVCSDYYFLAHAPRSTL